LNSVHFDLLFKGHPSVTKCLIQPEFLGCMSSWHKGQRLAAVIGLNGMQYFFCVC